MLPVLGPILARPLLVPDLEEAPVVALGQCIVTKLLGSGGGGGKIEEMVGVIRESLLGRSEGSLEVKGRPLEQRQVKKAVQVQGASDLVGVDRHREEVQHLDGVARGERPHDTVVEAVGGLAGGHLGEIDLRRRAEGTGLPHGGRSSRGLGPATAEHGPATHDEKGDEEGAGYPPGGVGGTARSGRCLALAGGDADGRAARGAEAAAGRNRLRAGRAVEFGKGGSAATAEAALGGISTLGTMHWVSCAVQSIVDSSRKDTTKPRARATVFRCAFLPPEVRAPMSASPLRFVLPFRKAFPRWLLALACLAAAGVVPATPLAGQVQADTLRPIPADAWGSPGAWTLLDRGREARGRIAEGLASYEGLMAERFYMGLSADLLRRERGVIHQTRTGWIRWTAEGERSVRWDGARRDLPLFGLSSARRQGQAEALGRRLARPILPPPLAFDPGSDRLFFGDEWVLNPLADTAEYHYRFAEGDTLSLRLPGDDAELRLLELRVEPRRSDSRLVAASLWFDQASGQLVRAGYRPARPFDLQVDSPDGGSDVPGFLLPIRAEIRYITVDHALFDFRWWIPRRFAFEGSGQVANLARFPVQFEWLVSELEVNEEPSSVFALPDSLPEGWVVNRATIERPDGDRELTVIVPPVDTFTANAPRPVRRVRAPSAFRPDELSSLEEELRRLLPSRAGLPLQARFGLQDGLTRFNRVEALSTGASVDLPLGGEVRGRGKVRIGVGDLEPGAELALYREGQASRLEVEAYRRLASSAEWERPFTFSRSLGTLLWGGERTPFYRTTGLGLARTTGSTTLRSEARLFAEEHRSARRTTSFHLGRALYGDTLPLNPPADRGRWAGGELFVGWQNGVDPWRVQLLAESRLEGAGGTTSYARGWASGAVRVPVGPTWSFALEGGLGQSAGDVPVQRRFYPGGPRVFRGARTGESSAEAFWFGRLEGARGPAGARITGFVDVLGAADRRDDLFRGSPEWAAGGGLSLLDGLLRIDLVRTLGDDGRVRLFAYLDGLL